MKLKTKMETKQFFQLFPSLITDFDLWTQSDGEYMDMIYFGNHSGEKPCSPLLETWAGTINQIALMVYSKYQRNWEQFKKYLAADYDIWDDVEDETRTIDENNYDRPQNWKTVSEGDAEDNQTEVNTSVYGFNSSNAVPDGKSESSTSSKITTEQSGTFEREKDYTETLHRQGSSKLRTGAEMMEFDDRFWANWNYFESIFRDTDKELTCPYYE